jgi:uncharacterized protein (TIGR02996 family)
VNRREFLVMLGGSAMGQVVLDWQPSNPKLDEVGELPAIRLAFAPSKIPSPDGGYQLVFTELTDDGPKSRMWQPKTPQELADADAFYQAARNHEGVQGVEQPPKTAAGKAARWLRDLLEPNPRKRTKTETALLRAIIAEPENNAPLLRYADWLEKRGSPQGEFIRVELQLDATEQDDPSRPPLDARWLELYEAHGEQFVSPLQKIGAMPVLCGAVCPRLSLKQGVIRRIEIVREGIVPEKMEDLFALAPLIDELRLDFENVAVKSIVERPEMAQVRRLEIACTMAGLDPIGVQALAESPHCGTLRDLKLGFNEIGPDGARWLTTARFLPQLQKLGLPGARIGLQGLLELLARDAFEQLRTLDLSQNDLDGEAVLELAKCPSLRFLEHLDLDDNPQSSGGLPAVGESAFAATLLSLTFSNTNPTVRELTSFAGGRFERLKKLDVSNDGIDEDGLAPFFNAAWLAGLIELDLAGNWLTREASQILSQVPFRRLKILNLGYNRLGDAGVVALTRSTHLATVRELSLRSISAGPEGVLALANSQRFPHLEYLMIDGNDIGYEGAVALAKTRHFNLKELWVDKESVGDLGESLLKNRYGCGVAFTSQRDHELSVQSRSGEFCHVAAQGLAGR